MEYVLYVVSKVNEVASHLAYRLNQQSLNKHNIFIQFTKLYALKASMEFHKISVFALVFMNSKNRERIFFDISNVDCNSKNVKEKGENFTETIKI